MFSQADWTWRTPANQWQLVGLSSDFPFDPALGDLVVMITVGGGASTGTGLTGFHSDPTIPSVLQTAWRFAPGVGVVGVGAPKIKVCWTQLIAPAAAAAPRIHRMLRSRSSLVLAGSLALAVGLAAQDEVVYYKFDAGPGGDRVLNFAPSTSPAPREGRVVSNALAAAWSGGRFVHGLAGLTHLAPNFARVETGWAPNVNGDFTYACFLRFGWLNPTPTRSHLLGVPMPGGFRAYIDGSSLLTAAVDGSATTYATNADVWQMALAGWVHVAFVVDTNRSTATYYVNGVADVRLPLGGGAQITAQDFWVGQHLASLPGSVFDLDEVRVLARAATPLEVQAWAGESAAASAAFGAGCGAQLVDSHGPPTLANGSYALVFGAQANAFGALAIGGSRFWLGAVPLPFDLGLVLPSLPGCLWQSSSDITFGVSLDAQGGGAFGLGVPNTPSLLYRPLFVQALFSDVVTYASTNALAISIGR